MIDSLVKLRPLRLIEKFARILASGEVGINSRGCDVATVVSVEPVGDVDIAVMGTSTKTYFAAGYAMHNSTKFDLPLIYGRFYSHGLPPVRKPQSLDTLTMAKQVGKHFSGKLAYLSSTLSAKKSGHAKFPGFALWAGVLAGNKEAWKEMEDYNNKDVLATEQLFKALLPYSKTGYAWSANVDKPVCPKCGSAHLQKRGFVATITGHYQRFKCLDCGGWSQARHTSRDRKQSKNFLKAI